MRLPLPLLESPLFLFKHPEELERALGDDTSHEEIAEIRRLVELRLPPVTSATTLATMLGLNAGIIWSLVNRNRRQYRAFEIRSGRKVRQIYSPKIALKTIQKWLSIQLSKAYIPPPYVHGFVLGRSHVTAAESHLGAKWVLSVDIENFFPTTSQSLVEQSLVSLGYSEGSAALIGSLCCLEGVLVQGSPSSPILANLCFIEADNRFSELAEKANVRFTRYADDLTFSSKFDMPQGLDELVLSVFEDLPWSVAMSKVHTANYPQRLKIHGLLVHGSRVRLTKGYRNRLRMYRHLKEKGFVDQGRQDKIEGHLTYENYIDGRTSPQETDADSGTTEHC